MCIYSLILHPIFKTSYLMRYESLWSIDKVFAIIRECIWLSPLALKYSVFIDEWYADSSLVWCGKPSGIYLFSVIPLRTWEKVRSSAEINLNPSVEMTLVESKNTFWLVVYNDSGVAAKKLPYKVLSSFLVIPTANRSLVWATLPLDLFYKPDLLLTKSLW